MKWLGIAAASRLATASVVVLGACGDDAASNDVVGPFSGPIKRFVVDRIELPRDANEAAEVAADIDGDSLPENKLGAATGALAAVGDLSTHSADMIASGVLASIVEIQADDLELDDTVGVRYLGRSDLTATPVGGRIVDGNFASNRTRDTTHPAAARPMLPVFVNADPIDLVMSGFELDLTPDGAGGYDGVFRGGAGLIIARDAAVLGFTQMVETEPERHLVFLRGVDSNDDNVLSSDEIDDSLIGTLVSADIQLYQDGSFAPVPGSTKPDSISLAFAFHLVPCAEGACIAAPPQNTCRDRVRDGDETDVDCGGSCQPCWTNKLCSVATDCQSRACNGVCAAPTCTDGVRDGFESDVDCGGICGACATGRACAADRDCTSGNCSNSALPGICG